MITFTNKTQYDAAAREQEAVTAAQSVEDGTCAGSAFLGWRDVPTTFLASDEYARMKDVAAEIRSEADAFVVIGIGGSYLGARAVIEALTPAYGRGVPQIYYAGTDISATQLAALRDALAAHKNIYLNVISKSGTTLEPALAFRVLRAYLEERYGAQGARTRIIATTDAASGALHDVARTNEYRMFTVPDDVGGRYSVLTPVGLLPIAVAGVDTDALLAGAAQQRQACRAPFAQNACLQYAATRTQVYRAGYAVDVFASYEPQFAILAEWWKQLFGESEGKEHKGLFPASIQCTTDLHSLGQYMQDGARIVCETVLAVDAEDDALHVPHSDSTADGLSAYEGLSLGAINRIAQDATIRAHRDGGVPVMQLTMPQRDAQSIGAALYFFEYACAVSALLLDVNPFDQPGVEVYKKNMYALLSDAVAKNAG